MIFAYSKIEAVIAYICSHGFFYFRSSLSVMAKVGLIE